MDEIENTGAIHWSFWGIAVVTLVWNLLGVINFFAQMDPEILTVYRESERMIVDGRPVWATVGFAAAVFSGALGCLLLLFRHSAAFYFYIFSLLGVIVTMVHSLSLEITFGVGEILGIIVMPVIVAVFIIWYYRYCMNKSWIRQ